MMTEKKATLEQIKDTQQLMRSMNIRRNSRFVCARAFHMRKDYFINEETGVLTAGKKRPVEWGWEIFWSYFGRKKAGYDLKSPKQILNPRLSSSQQKNPMSDPGMASEMMKGQMLNMMPNMAIGYLINVLFSGFLIAKVPFPLTFRFKTMLQRGIDLPELDASWISSASWYFICIQSTPLCLMD